MTDINTTLRGDKEVVEDPKNGGVIATKIGKGFGYICLVVALFTLSSWQLPLITNTINCYYGKEKYKQCPYPANINAPPYNSNISGKSGMDTTSAFQNVLMSVIADGLSGLAQPPKQRFVGKRQRGGGINSNKVGVSSGGAGTGNSNAGGLSNVSIQWGDTKWKPFDLHSKDIGWPYDDAIKEPFVSFEYWLAKSQILAWSAPRQMLQAGFLFLANFMDPQQDESVTWLARFVITCILPIILIVYFLLSGFVSFFTTIWGGFFQHIIDGNIAAVIWGFFFTWAITLYNIFAQPFELLFSYFVIPWGSGGRGWIKSNWRTFKNNGYREIILWASFIAFMAVVISAFKPLMDKSPSKALSPVGASGETQRPVRLSTPPTSQSPKKKSAINWMLDSYTMS